MGVFDKFLDIMKLNDDGDYDDYDDEFYDDDFDDFDEKPQRKGGLFRRDKDIEEDDYDFPEERKSGRTSSKITPMRQPASRSARNMNMEVCVIKPSSVEDSRDITETLLDGRTVILNLEGLDLEIAGKMGWRLKGKK